jgi:hypothetical protein
VAAMYDWFFNCQKYMEECSKSMDSPTSWLHKFFMWLGCAICKDSRNFTRQLNTLRETARMDELTPDMEIAETHLPEEAINRVKSAIEKEYANFVSNFKTHKNSRKAIHMSTRAFTKGYA